MKHIQEFDFRELIPNLDGFATPVEMKELQNDFKEMEQTCKLLKSYAEAKEMAMVCRQRGNIDLAQKFENAGQSVYDQLPHWVRW